MFHVNLPGCNFPGYVVFFPQDGFGLLLGGLSPFLQSSWDPGGPRPGDGAEHHDVGEPLKVWGHDMTLNTCEQSI